MDPEQVLDQIPSDMPNFEPPAEPAPPAPDPYRDLSGRVDALAQAMQAFALSQAQRQPVYAPPPPPATPPENPYQYKPREFLDADTAQTLLTSNDPKGVLNKLFNQVGEAVYSPVMQQLQQRDAYILAMQQQQQQEALRQQQQAAAQQHAAQLLQEHPELQPVRHLIPLAVQELAQEGQQNPLLFMNKSTSDLFGMVADHVMKQVNYLRSYDSGADDPPATSPPARRGNPAFVERGSGARPSGAPLPKDPSKRALVEMSRYLGRR